MAKWRPSMKDNTALVVLALVDAHCGGTNAWEQRRISPRLHEVFASSAGGITEEENEVGFGSSTTGIPPRAASICCSSIPRTGRKTLPRSSSSC